MIRTQLGGALRRASCLIVLSALAAAQSAPNGPAELLARARAAIGWERLERAGSAIEVVGDARFLGTDCRQTMLFDGRGRFAESFDGVLAQRDGFDGELAWVIDWTNTARVLELGDRASSRVTALLLSGGWAAADGPLEFESASRGSGGELVLEFRYEDGVLTGEVRLDPRTALPRSARFGAGNSRTSWSFADYEDHDGFRFPERITLEQEGLEQRLDTRSVELFEDVPDARFAAQLAQPADARFDPELPPALEVRQVPSGHLLVHPTIDGQDLGWFIFDSGAGIHCIAKHVVDRLSDGPFGEIRATGVGGTVPAHFWRAEQMRLGPLTVDAPIFMELDLAFLERPFGVRVGGIIGFELFARCAVEFDQQAAAIALHDPAEYELPAPGTWEAAVLYGRHPCVRAAVEGREGLFKIDTGAANDTVTMHYQAVRSLELLTERETRAGRAGGVGGGVATRDGLLASFVLGGHRFEPLEASFAVEDKGAFGDAYVQGNIGGKLLEPFRLVFDYPNRRLGFVPR